MCVYKQHNCKVHFNKNSQLKTHNNNNSQLNNNNTHSHTHLQLGTYVDKDIEKLISLSQMEVEEEVKDIFRHTLCVDPRSRPSALQLLAYPALRNGERERECERVCVCVCVQYGQ